MPGNLLFSPSKLISRRLQSKAHKLQLEVLFDP
jgi:hypothetical protein